MTEVTGEVVSKIHNHLQRARSEAGAIEDPSGRRALQELADAVEELLAAVRAG